MPVERICNLAKRLHDLGPRPLYEFLREVASGSDPIDRLEIYARLDPAIVRALGGDQFPTPAIITRGRG